MRGGLIAIVAAGAIVAVAVFEGVRSNRWGATEDVRAASAKLDKVSIKFGNWVGTDAPIDEKIIRIAEASGNVSRFYENSKSKERVTVLLLCGPTGPIAAHTPEVCYGGLGFACKGKPARKTLTFANTSAGSFWTARFEKKSLNDEAQKVYWAWSGNGDWEASSNPRTDYALRTVLYKLYVSRADDPASQPRDPKNEPIENFLEEFLPIVKSALSSASG
jgi:hypothetical protein